MTAPGEFDPLSVDCPYCATGPGERCWAVSGWASRPHAARVRRARAVAAHADPRLDRWFPLRSQCGICGVPGMPQRHRRIDAIAGQLAAGECEEDVAGELEVPLEAVLTVMAWAGDWPGAWR